MVGFFRWSERQAHVLALLAFLDPCAHPEFPSVDSAIAPIIGMRGLFLVVVLEKCARSCICWSIVHSLFLRCLSLLISDAIALNFTGQLTVLGRQPTSSRFELQSTFLEAAVDGLRRIPVLKAGLDASAH